MRYLLALVLVGFMAGCATHANTPSTVNLSQTGLDEYNKTRVIHALDIIRDAAIDGEKLNVFSHQDTVNIVTYHKSTVQVIAVSGAGWRTTVSASLDEVVKHLTAGAATKVAPYVALVKTILAEVQ